MANWFDDLINGTDEVETVDFAEECEEEDGFCNHCDGYGHQYDGVSKCLHCDGAGVTPPSRKDYMTSNF